MTTDPATQRMCDETGHSCMLCPEEIRSLASVAHNFAWRVEALLNGSGDPGKVREHLTDLQSALKEIEPVRKAHFTALNDWRRP
jgi:hypothetical protein